MRKKDFLIALVIGELSAWLIFPIWFNARLFFNFWPWRFWLLIILPILAIAGLGIISLLREKIFILWQFAKFILVGILNTLVDLGILNILILIFHIAWGIFYSVFKGISFLAAVINSYFWNKYWVFESKEGRRREFFQFFLVSLIGFGINVGTASFIVNILGPQFGLEEKIWANVGAIVATLMAMLWNFLGYKFLVFKK